MGDVVVAQTARRRDTGKKPVPGSCVIPKSAKGKWASMSRAEKDERNIKRPGSRQNKTKARVRAERTDESRARWKDVKLKCESQSQPSDARDFNCEVTVACVAPSGCIVFIVK